MIRTGGNVPMSAFVIGDLHGHLDRLLGLLAEAGLTGPAGMSVRPGRAAGPRSG